MIELTGAEYDVFHALFTRGALESGDLPSKSGASSLIERGYVMVFEGLYQLTLRGRFYWEFYTEGSQK